MVAIDILGWIFSECMMTKLEQYKYDALETTRCWCRAEDVGIVWEEYIAALYMIRTYTHSAEIQQKRKDTDRIFDVRGADDEGWGRREELLHQLAVVVITMFLLVKRTVVHIMYTTQICIIGRSSKPRGEGGNKKTPGTLPVTTRQMYICVRKLQGYYVYF